MTDPPIPGLPPAGPLSEPSTLDHQLGFKPWACSCSAAATLLAAMEGREPELCRVHDAAEIAARKATAKRDQDQAHADRIRDVRDELRAEDELARRRRDREKRDAEIAQRREGVDPLALVLGDLVGRPDPGAWSPMPGHDRHPAGQDVAIGDDAAFVRILTGLLGPGTVNNGNYPDAA